MSSFPVRQAKDSLGDIYGLRGLSMLGLEWLASYSSEADMICPASKSYKKPVAP